MPSSSANTNMCDWYIAYIYKEKSRHQTGFMIQTCCVKENIYNKRSNVWQDIAKPCVILFILNKDSRYSYESRKPKV